MCILSRFSNIWLFATLWTLWILCNPMNLLCPGDSPAKYWSGLPCSSPGNLPNTGVDKHLLSFLHCQAGPLLLSASWKAQKDVVHIYNGILLRDGSFVEMLMDLESIIHSKVSQKDKNKYHVLTYIWNLEKWYDAFLNFFYDWRSMLLLISKCENWAPW